MLAPAEKLIAAIDKVTGIDPSFVDATKLLEAHRMALAACRARIDADSGVPGQREELSRKALTAAHDAVHRLDVGLDEKPTTIAVVAAIIDTISGLIDPDVTLALNATLKELRK